MSSPHFKEKYFKPKILKFDSLKKITLCTCQPLRGSCPQGKNGVCAVREPPMEPPGPCVCRWSPTIK